MNIAECATSWQSAVGAARPHIGIFSPQMYFGAKFFSTWMRVNCGKFSPRFPKISQNVSTWQSILQKYNLWQIWPLGGAKKMSRGAGVRRLLAKVSKNFNFWTTPLTEEPWHEFVSKHLKGHLGAPVRHVTFFNCRGQLADCVGHVFKCVGQLDT